MQSASPPRISWPVQLLAMAVFSSLLGCGQAGPERYTISGKITYDGQPVPLGEVIFEPDGSQGNSGPQCRASIRQGIYETRAGKGAVAGPMIVKVIGFEQPTGEGRFPGVEAFSLPLFPTFETRHEVPAHDSTFDIKVE